ncbi:MAG: amidohydrolase [Puniceicoccaceae bacterium 5H]|nr:MAG: amidohydrolase [Puniceicoccaceae bacterium 5H]
MSELPANGLKNRSLNLALVQMDCEPGRVQHNVDRMLGCIDEASAAGADLVVLPEMADTGYRMGEIVAHASSWNANGPLQQLQQAARENTLHIIAGLSERTAEGVYNTLAVIDAQGELVAKYRKVHLITADPVFEHHHLLAGDRFQVCSLGGFTVGLMTCYDLRFPEMARALTLAGAELIVCPAAFPLLRGAHWQTLALARAIENQTYLAACNRVGTDGGVTFAGRSQLIDPYGTIVASTTEVDSTIIYGEIRRERVAEVRERLQCLPDRCPDIYSRPVQTH